MERQTGQFETYDEIICKLEDAAGDLADVTYSLSRAYVLLRKLSKNDLSLNQGDRDLAVKVDLVISLLGGVNIEELISQAERLKVPPEEELFAIGEDWANDYIYERGLEEAEDQASGCACDLAYSMYPNAYEYAADMIYEGMMRRIRGEE